ncbi:hypothetical protein MHK_003213 [Candidatus Magnetomorum sp. HK-1]|nr:hypothetical protein MHK_003213 [Candidatus Magnetomorum sp. HK-1]
MNPVEKIFKTLPKRLEWKSFYANDLPLIVGICEDIVCFVLEFVPDHNYIVELIKSGVSIAV